MLLEEMKQNKGTSYPNINESILANYTMQTQSLVQILFFLKIDKNIDLLTPSDAVIIECKFGMESALSIFTITWMSAPASAGIDIHS